MDKDEMMDDVSNKIVDLLNETNPRLDILECIEVLRDIESSFIESLKDNLRVTDGEGK